MAGIRSALEEGSFEQFIEEFYQKRGMEVPSLENKES